jgi:hypothetical protein
MRRWRSDGRGYRVSSAALDVGGTCIGLLVYGALSEPIATARLLMVP